MVGINQLTEPKRRLAILVSLSVATKYRLTLSDARAAADGCGYAASLATVGADALWLEETGLIEYDRSNQFLTITERGLDVATGVAEAPGVGKPAPGA